MADRYIVEQKLGNILAFTAPELVLWKIMMFLENEGLFDTVEIDDDGDEVYVDGPVISYIDGDYVDGPTYDVEWY